MNNKLKLTSIYITAVLVLLLQGCTNSVTNQPLAKSATVKPNYYIYLAGPEVFLPDPIGPGVKKKAIIDQLNQTHNWPFQLVGLYPMDNEIEDFAHDAATGIAIYHANIDLMNQADFITANMVRFRGPSMDVGTAFEMGYMSGLNKPVLGYYDSEPFYGTTEKPGLFIDRVAEFYQVSEENPGRDINGQSIENFQMSDNLMMMGSLQKGEGKISDSFEAAVLKIADLIIAQQ